MARKKTLGLSYDKWLKARQPPYWPDVAELVLVLWEDAVKVEEHKDEGDATPIRAATGLFVLEADHKHIVVSPEIFEDESSRDATGIPRGMVQRVIPIAKLKLFDEQPKTLP